MFDQFLRLTWVVGLRINGGYLRAEIKTTRAGGTPCMDPCCGFSQCMKDMKVVSGRQWSRTVQPGLLCHAQKLIVIVVPVGGWSLIRALDDNHGGHPEVIFS